MFGLCVSFFFVVRSRNAEFSLGAQKVNVQRELEKYNDKITKSYPSTPKEVIELNNEMMRLLYSKDMKEADAGLYAETIRNLYDKELLELNSKEDQVSLILIDLQQNAAKSISLLESKIEEVTLEEDGAAVKVIHYLNINDLTRVYKLTRSSGEWKIVSWENLKQDSIKSEE
jgi:hypothetical protein